MVEGAYCNIATQHCNKPTILRTARRKIIPCLRKFCALPREIKFPPWEHSAYFRKTGGLVPLDCLFTSFGLSVYFPRTACLLPKDCVLTSQGSRATSQGLRDSLLWCLLLRMKIFKDNLGFCVPYDFCYFFLCCLFDLLDRFKGI